MDEWYAGCANYSAYTSQEFQKMAKQKAFAISFKYGILSKLKSFRQKITRLSRAPSECQLFLTLNVN